MREPVGVCGLIIPWNFPLLMASWKLAPALACGNVVDPEARRADPAYCPATRRTDLEAGLPDGVVNIRHRIRTGRRQLNRGASGCRQSCFTGSTEVGEIILKAAAGNLKRVSLELGGKSPNIIFPDADLEGGRFRPR